jgi:hypothetical protein
VELNQRGSKSALARTPNKCDRGARTDTVTNILRGSKSGCVTSNMICKILYIDIRRYRNYNRFSREPEGYPLSMIQLTHRYAQDSGSAQVRAAAAQVRRLKRNQRKTEMNFGRVTCRLRLVVIIDSCTNGKWKNGNIIQFYNL